MVSRVLLLVLLLLARSASAQTANAYIKLAIDSDTVYFGDTVVLDMESTGLLDPIDLTPLTRNATLLRETTGTRIAVIKGKVVEIAIRRMDLTPTRPGLLIFGPITAGPVQSNSVHVNVLNASRPTWQPAPDDLSIAITATPESPYVGQQTTLDIKLRHRYPINSEQVALPALNEFASRVQREQIRTTDKDNWFEVHWRYFVFPKRSGSLTLDPLVWRGNITRSHSERADFERKTEPFTINVKPATDSKLITENHWWLPSNRLTMTESWSQPATSLRAGDELTRTITVTAEGNLSGQIPTPEPPASRAITQTPLATRRTESITADAVIATAEFEFRVRAQSPIPVFLDTVRLAWWNTELDQQAEAIVPARRINVGLPDRADLLAELARQDTGTSRFKAWLQRTSWLRLSIYFMASVCLLYLFVISSARIFRPLANAPKRRQIKRELLALSDQPDKLYARINQLINDGTIRTDCPPVRQLNESLQQSLFQTRQQTTSTAHLKQQIRDLLRHPGLYHRRVDSQQQSTDLLTDL